MLNLPKFNKELPLIDSWSGDILEESYWEIRSYLDTLATTEFSSDRQLTSIEDKQRRDVFCWQDSKLKNLFQAKDILEELTWRRTKGSELKTIHPHSFTDTAYLDSYEKTDYPLVHLLTPMKIKKLRRVDGSGIVHRLGYIALDLDHVPEGHNADDFWKTIEEMFKDLGTIIPTVSNKLKVLFPIILRRNTPYSILVIKKTMVQILNGLRSQVEPKHRKQFEEWFLDKPIYDTKYSAFTRSYCTKSAFEILKQNKNLSPWIVASNLEEEIRPYEVQQGPKQFFRRDNLRFDKLVGASSSEDIFYFFAVSNLITNYDPRNSHHVKNVEGLISVIKYLMGTSNGFLHGYDLSLKHLAEYCGKSLAYVHKYVKLLEELGCIVCINSKFQAGVKAKTYTVTGKLARVFRYYGIMYGGDTSRFKHVQYSTVNMSIELEHLRYRIINLSTELQEEYKDIISSNLNTIEATISGLEYVRLEDVQYIPNEATGEASIDLLISQISVWLKQITGESIVSFKAPVIETKVRVSTAGKKAKSFVQNNNLDLTNSFQMSSLSFKDLGFLYRHQEHFSEVEKQSIRKNYFSSPNYVTKEQRMNNKSSAKVSTPLPPPNFSMLPVSTKHVEPLESLDLSSRVPDTPLLDNLLLPSLNVYHQSRIKGILEALKSCKPLQFTPVLSQALDESSILLEELVQANRLELNFEINEQLLEEIEELEDDEAISTNLNPIVSHTPMNEYNKKRGEHCYGDGVVGLSIHTSGEFVRLPKQLGDGQWDYGLWYAATRCSKDQEQRYFKWVESLPGIADKKDRRPHAVSTWEHRMYLDSQKAG